MERFLALTGGALLLGSGAFALWSLASPASGQYPLTIYANNGTFQVSGKPPGELFHVAFDGSVQWVFTNATGGPVQVKLDTWETMSSGLGCPVKFVLGGGPGNCEATLPSIPPKQSGQISAEPTAGTVSDAANPYSFYISVGEVGGQLRRVDPELQIDNVFVLDPAPPAVLGLLLVILSLWLRRRARVHRS